MSSELLHACSLASIRIRNTLRPHIEDIVWTSEFAETITKYFAGFTGSSVDLSVFRSHLASKSFLEEEIDRAVEYVEDFQKEKSDQDYTTLLQDFRSFYNNKRLAEIVNGDQVSADDIINRIKNLPTIAAEQTPVHVLGNLNVKEVIEREIGTMEALPTTMTIIRDATPWKGYLRGQVVQVVAPPGCVHGDTIIRTKNGDKFIKDLSEDDLVLASTAEGVAWVRHQGAIKAKEVNRWLVIETHSGSMRVCEDHLMLTPSGNYVPAALLRPGSMLGYLSGQTNEIKVLPEDRKGLRHITGDNLHEFLAEVPRMLDEASNELLPHIKGMEIVDIRIEELESPEIAYDVAHVELYSNYATVLEDGAVIFSHNTGKSLFIANECVAMLGKGLGVMYCALGDMFLLDFIIRLSAIITNSEYYKVATSPEVYYNDIVRETTQKMHIVIEAAGVLSIEDLYDMMKQHVIPLMDVDVFVLDYDSNLKKMTGSMYEEGDYVFNKLTEIARPNDARYRLVFVASQPKIQYWENEKLPKEASGESSRKQAIVDLIITIGRSKDAVDKHIGIMYMAKVRRGREGLESPYKVSPSGRFTPLSRDEYAMNKSYKK